MYTILVLFLCGRVVYGVGSVAPFIHPCDPADLACLKRSAQAAVPYLARGVPELGLSPLDPVTIPHMETNEAGLQLTFTDTVIKGLGNCTVMSLRRLDNRTAIDLRCSVTLVGRYKLSGTLLILPIRGDGKYKITIRNIIVKTLLDIEQQVRGGRRYWRVTGWSHTSEMPTFVRFRFYNLFGGDERLSKQIHAFANKSWYEIFQEVSPPVTRAIVARIVEETTKLFNAVPLDQLAKE
ncbi:protein takeout-like [Aricia agestis]|uniref:protein takeout-like n=1 Tax=Aricia agestis TaxID=91739 RepID=UPI001C2034FC|nr:protein takeout-like [Aricia agestis]